MIVGYWNERRRNSAIGLSFVLCALYGAPFVRSRLGLLTYELELIQAVLMGCAVFFFLRGMRATVAGKTQVSAGSQRVYIIAGVALAVVAFAVALLVGKNP